MKSARTHRAPAHFSLGLDLQRFLDIVTMRTHAAIAVAENPEDFAPQMTEREAQGQQDWAAGFTLGCEKFKAGPQKL